MEVVDGSVVTVRAGSDARGLYLDLGESVRVRLPGGWLDGLQFQARVEAAVYRVRGLEQVRLPLAPVPAAGEPGTQGWT